MPHRPITWLFFLLPAAFCGCGGGAVEYFDEMEMLPAKEELLEFPMGHFGIPVPVKPLPGGTEWTHGNSINVAFNLFAVIRPSDEKAITKSWDRYELRFRDEVLIICRGASLGELTEPGLATVKGRLSDATRRCLGNGRVRRLVMTEIKVEQL